MWIRKAALAACGLLACAASTAQAPQPLTFDATLQRVLSHHPQLQMLELERIALEAERSQAALQPGYVLHADVENIAGTGARSGLSGSEWSLSLASVLERGGKRAARDALAARRLDAEGPRRVGAQLDLLAETARRYLALVQAQSEQQIASEDLLAREHLRQVAALRVKAGATPVSVSLAAEVAVVSARMDVDRAATRRAAAWRRLALMWGDTSTAQISTAPEDPLQIPPAPVDGDLQAIIERNPALKLLAAESRIREARLQLAQAARIPDLEWRAGLRHLEEGNDWALVAGVSIPLGTRARAVPAIDAAQAHLDALALERDVAGRELMALLADAQGLLAAARMQVMRTRDELLPRYDAAIEAAERAFRAGALGPLDWMQLQNDRLTARREQLAAAVSAHLALIEMQRLTAEPLRGLVPANGDNP
jgi:outer membrane protein, heavy metal efflux system